MCHLKNNKKQIYWPSLINTNKTGSLRILVAKPEYKLTFDPLIQCLDPILSILSFIKGRE